MKQLLMQLKMRTVHDPLVRVLDIARVVILNYLKISHAIMNRFAELSASKSTTTRLGEALVEE